MNEYTPDQLKDDIEAILSFYIESKPSLFNAYVEEFLVYVRPDIDLDGIEAEMLMSFMTEWFIFDSKLPFGLTPLQEYLRSNPGQLDEATLARLAELEATHFTADFLFSDADVDAGTIKLKLVGADREYLLHEPLLSEELAGEAGMASLRIAQAGGRWLMPGYPVFVLPGDFPELLFSDDGEPNAAQPFIDLVAEVFGGGGDQEDEPLFFGEWQPTPGTVEEVLEQIGQRYDELVQQLGGSRSWTDFKAALTKADPDTNALDILDSFVDPDYGDTDAYIDLVNLFMASWNLLPHDYLDGKSPYQLDLEKQAAQDEIE